MTRFLLTLILFLTTTLGFGQIEELTQYKKLYATADSLNKLEQPFSVDSLTIQRVNSLDKLHPAKYFEAVGELIKDTKYNEAAFVYYLGLLRYRYYNTANPDYQSSGDGALAASLRYVFGEPINLFLKTNIDNFIAALTLSSEYYSKNDYAFYPKTKDSVKYNDVAKSFSGLIEDLKVNKAKYRQEWNEQRKTMIGNIDKSIDEYNKMTPKEKAKLKHKN